MGAVEQFERDLDERSGVRQPLDLGGGRTIEVRRRGSGPVLVFVHGLLVHGGLWRGVVDRLSREHDCVTLELPFGSHRVPVPATADLSPLGLAEMVRDALVALDLQDVVVVANDTGGAVAQVLVTRWPERTAGLVLTGCDAFENFEPLVLRYLQVLARVPGGIATAAHLLRLPGATRLPITYGRATARPLPAPVRASYSRPLIRSAAVRADTARVLRAISRRYTREAARALPGYDRPALVVWGEQDRLFPVAHAHALAALLPDSRTVLLPGTGAFVPEDSPEELADQIEGWLRARRLRTAAGQR